MAKARAAAKKKKSYHHGDLRQALIDAALELIAREGAGVVSLRELAVRVGVSHAAPYRHFKSREALFAAVAEQGFKMLKAAMQDARAAAGKDPRERLMATGIAYVKFAVAHPAHLKLMFSALGHPQAEIPGTALEGMDAFAVLVESIVEAQNAGLLRSGDPLPHAIFAWSGVHGLSMLLIEKILEPMGVTDSVDAQARRLVADLIDGVGKR